jgi:hypothetical protein
MLGTAQHVDDDGRLRLAGALLTQAGVSRYKGAELLRDGRARGIDPNKIYRLFRPADELRRAAAGFAGVPLLARHAHVTAASPQPSLVCGVVGNPVFRSPYLTADVTVWTRDAINDLKTGIKPQLSAAYNFSADMDPGEFGGMRYDGVMRDIAPNHIAIVERSRRADAVPGEALAAA